MECAATEGYDADGWDRNHPVVLGGQGRTQGTEGQGRHGVALGPTTAYAAERAGFGGGVEGDDDAAFAAFAFIELAARMTAARTSPS